MRFPRSMALGIVLLGATAVSQEETGTTLSTGESFRAAAESIEIDLREAIEELGRVREQIAGEKPAIAKEANEVAANLRESRRKADIARTRRDAVEDEFAKREAEMKSWRDEKTYLESLLLDFRKTREAIRPFADPGAPVRFDLESNLAALEESLGVLEEAGRVSSASGEATGEDGILVPGTFVSAGPVSWFLPGNGSAPGITVAGDGLSTNWIEGSASKAAIEALLAGETASPSLDPTLGTAVALEETDSSLLSHIEKGGFWIYPILLLAAIALIAAIAKWFQLIRIRPLSPAKVQEIVHLASSDHLPEALNEAGAVRHPAARVLTTGIKLSGGKEDSRSREDIEEAMFEQFLAEQPRLQRGLPLIAIASATAPLLGLLGTVTGMIETFRLINIFGTGDAKTLASGISEALVTTEFGLIVAIPALILHALLSRKVQGIKSTMEMASLAFLNGVAAPKPEPLRPVS